MRRKVVFDAPPTTADPDDIGITSTALARYRELYPGATKPEVAHVVGVARALSKEEAAVLLDHLVIADDTTCRLHSEHTGAFLCRISDDAADAFAAVTFVAFKSHRMRTRAVQLHGEGDPPTCLWSWTELHTTPSCPDRVGQLLGIAAASVRTSAGLRRHLEDRSIAGALMSVDWQPGPGPTPPAWLEKHHAQQPWDDNVQHGRLDDKPIAVMKRTDGSVWASWTPTLHLPDDAPRTRSQAPMQPRERVDREIPWLGVLASDVELARSVENSWGLLRHGQYPDNANQRRRLRWELRFSLLRIPPPRREAGAFRPTLGSLDPYLTQQAITGRWWLTMSPLYEPPLRELEMAEALKARGWKLRAPLRDPDTEGG